MSTSAPSWWLRLPAVLNYGIAVVSAAAAVAIDLAFRELWGVDPSVSLFLCTVMLVAWASGPGPALATTTLTILAFDYFFLQPIHSFALEFKEIPRLVLFAVAAVLVVLLSQAQRRTTASLRRARDEQHETVRKLQALNETLRIENAERRQAEERARLAQKELQLTIDTIPVLAARYRSDGFMEFRNRHLRDYTGFSKDNVEGQRWGAPLHPDDLHMVEREWREHGATGKPFGTEQRLRRADGEYRWHWVQRVPLRDEDGNVVKWYGVAFDIDDRKRVENALRRSEADLAAARHELQLIIDTVPVLVLRHRADGIIDFVNQVGRSYSGIISKSWTKRTSVITHPDDVSRLEAAWDVALAKGEPFETEQRLRRADGEYRWFFSRRVPLRNSNGDVIAWYGAALDIEDRKRAEDALRQSEAELAKARQELQLIIDTVPVLMVRHRADGVIDFMNQVGRSYSGIVSTNWTKRTSGITHPDDVSRLEEAWDVALATGESFETEQRLRRADGEYRWFVTRRVPLRNRDGDMIAWYGAAYDIEDRKRAENALRRSEARLASAERELRLMIDSIPVMVTTYQPDGTRIFVNQAWQRFTGLSQEEACGGDLMGPVHPDHHELGDSMWRASLATGEPFVQEKRLRRADGQYRWHWVRRVPLRDETGKIVKWYGAGFDVEDQKQAESALQRIQAYAAEAQKLSQTGSFAWEVATRDYFWSDQTYQILGFDRSVKPSISLVVQRTHPEDRFIMERELDRSAQRAPYHDFKVRLLMPDGQIKHIHLLAHRITYQSGNEEIVGAVMDITAARKSQEALDAAQAALAHASRVATLGEVSATIAHEVNQPLAAIVANAQACLRFLRRETPDLNDVRGAVEWIVKDGNRAGEIIRRVRGLLKKVDTEKLPFNVNDIIHEVVALLQRELNEKSVTLQLELAPSMPLTVADRVQLQQVIINLIMNGAEAMQKITDRPHLLVVGSYENEADQVVVAVKDCGAGIPPEIADRLFDAFFSTKPSGLGIGLSICRSIIQDHGGELWATENSEGPGATFRFALPAHRDSTPPNPAAANWIR